MTKKLTKFGSFAIAAALSASAFIGASCPAGAETPTAEATSYARVEELQTAMKDVGKAVEPSVVDIVVQKKVGGSADASADGEEQDGDIPDQLKKMFPDNDGDGQPDVPPGLRFRFGPNGNRPQIETGEGSGVILDATADKAYILTNNHVAGGATKFVVTLSDGRKIEDVKVLGTDPRSDLAVLEIKAEGLKATRWGDSDKLEKGDIVLAFGAPFGYVGSMTQGIVSGKNRTTASRTGLGLLGKDGYEYFIQTDCAINPGNSGGPLVNLKGEIVGINTAIASTTGSFNGIGFAVPSSLAKSVYTQLKESGKVTRGFLGVEIRDTTELTKQQVKRLKLDGKNGVWVGGAKATSPAAGKLLPDDVIVAFNGEKVETKQELRLRVASTKPDTDVKVDVIRNGKAEQVALKLGVLPEREELAANQKKEAAAESSNDIGATLGSANGARLKAFGLSPDAKGALVTAVKDGSPAQNAGLAIGDLITKVNDTEVADSDAAIAALKEAKLSDGISLLVENKEGTRSIFVQVEE